MKFSYNSAKIALKHLKQIGGLDLHCLLILHVPFEKNDSQVYSSAPLNHRLWIKGNSTYMQLLCRCSQNIPASTCNNSASSPIFEMLLDPPAPQLSELPPMAPSHLLNSALCRILSIHYVSSHRG